MKTKTNLAHFHREEPSLGRQRSGMWGAGGPCVWSSSGKTPPKNPDSNQPPAWQHSLQIHNRCSSILWLWFYHLQYVASYGCWVFRAWFSVNSPGHRPLGCLVQSWFSRGRWGPRRRSQTQRPVAGVHVSSSARRWGSWESWAETCWCWVRPCWEVGAYSRAPEKPGHWPSWPL